MVGFVLGIGCSCFNPPQSGHVRVRRRTVTLSAAPLPGRVKEFLSKVPGDAVTGLTRADAGWQRIKDIGSTSAGKVKTVVTERLEREVGATDFDVVVCGGTLGIFIASALAKHGFTVAVIERGRLQGRDQEWNVSRKEMEVLSKLGLLSEEEIEEAILTEYNPARIGFSGMKDIFVKDILNCGVSPRILLQFMKTRFEQELGGTILENHNFESAVVGEDGVEMPLTVFEGASGSLGAGGDGAIGETTSTKKTLRARLLIDAMGTFSPIVRQLRKGQPPDGICLVVGSCAEANWPNNESGDLIYSFTPIENNLQYFWEAFPSQSKGQPSDLRTTYMFSYLDADEKRPSLAEFYDSYLEWLPSYQGVGLGDVQPTRALFGAFPTYRDSPLKSQMNRVLMFGDSSGVQSPLSFGGLGAMLRHLERINKAVTEALTYDVLDKDALALITPYMPALSVTWLFQRAMSVDAGRSVPDRELINKVLKTNFSSMERMGDNVLRPFLQDVVQFDALTRTLVGMTLSNPALVVKVMAHVGLLPVVDWTRHYLALAAYDVANRLLPLFPATSDETVDIYYRARLEEILNYGAGQDYEH